MWRAWWWAVLCKVEVYRRTYFTPAEYSDDICQALLSPRRMPGCTPQSTLTRIYIYIAELIQNQNVNAVPSSEASNRNEGENIPCNAVRLVELCTKVANTVK